MTYVFTLIHTDSMKHHPIVPHFHENPEESNHLGVLFMSRGRNGCEADRHRGAVPEVLWTLTSRLSTFKP